MNLFKWVIYLKKNAKTKNDLFVYFFQKKTKQTYNIEFDEANSLAKQTTNNTQPKKTNVSVKIPDLISNATTSYPKTNSYARLNEQDYSDNETKSKATYSATPSNSHSIQMQHEVENLLK